MLPRMPYAHIFATRFADYAEITLIFAITLALLFARRFRHAAISVSLAQRPPFALMPMLASPPRAPLSHCHMLMHYFFSLSMLPFFAIYAAMPDCCWLLMLRR